MIKNIRYTWVLFITAVSLLLSGCAHYKSRPFKQVGRDGRMPSLIGQVDDKVLVHAHALSKTEVSHYFGSRVASRKKATPVLLTVNNPTKKVLVLDAWDIGLHLRHVDDVLRDVKYNAAQRIITWSVLGLFIPLFFIPAVVDGVNSTEANQSMQQDFYDRVLSCDSYIKIYPHSTMSRVMFVQDSSWQKAFDVKIADRKTGQKTTINVTIA